MEIIRNTGYFKNKTALISGASRGIGLAIAKKLAADGANIVIAAKTAEPHPKLPGTIYTAANEIEQVGGKCLPCVVDVRDEDSVKKAVEEAVNRFGGIDILVNNASAISISSTVNTDMKRYDLMHSIKSKTCIPYLRKSSNPHILNISPPIDMNPRWFAPHLAYTMSKYGMSIICLGLHEELRDEGIAVNTLWPRTIIWTAAISNVISRGEDKTEAIKQCRKPDIMADAAYLILKKPSRKFTGNFLIDDTFLSDEGLKPENFLQYAYDPNQSPNPDFFVPSTYRDPMEEWDKKAKI